MISLERVADVIVRHVVMFEKVCEHLMHEFNELLSGGLHFYSMC
jgi:hypothetical protein